MRLSCFEFSAEQRTPYAKGVLSCFEFSAEPRTPPAKRAFSCFEFSAEPRTPPAKRAFSCLEFSAVADDSSSDTLMKAVRLPGVLRGRGELTLSERDLAKPISQFAP